MKLKYLGRADCAAFFGFFICAFYKSILKDLDIDAIIPVPTHKERERKRGYNQAELISRYISKELNIPHKTGIVKRSRKTTALKTLGYHERRAELHGAFTVNPQKVHFRNVLLVDDIFTTGSTLDEISDLLKKYGVINVYSVTACIKAKYH